MDWLAQLRKQKRLSQFRIATMCSISQQAYSLIENGARRPSVKVAKKIAQTLDFDWTLFFEDNADIKARASRHSTNQSHTTQKYY